VNFRKIWNISIDIITRIIAICYFGLIGWWALKVVLALGPKVFDQTATVDEIRLIVVRLTAVLFSGLLVGIYIFRSPPLRKSSGIMPRIVAFLNAVILPALMMLPSQIPLIFRSGPARHQAIDFLMKFKLLPWVSSMELAIAGLILVGIGHLLSAFVLSFLGRSFSILPEARKLVQHGPYRIVRHPLYAVEFIAVIGLVLQNLGWWTLFILAVHLPILLIRMNYEEKVLTAEFPEYTKYKRKTKRLIPYVF